MLMLIEKEVVKAGVIPISIHLMLMLIVDSAYNIVAFIIFQYISC